MEKPDIKQHYFPTRDFVVLKEEKIEKTAGGIILPEAVQDRKMGLRVIAVGPDVKGIEVNDLVTLGPAVNIIEFELFGETFIQVNSFNIIAKVSEDADFLNNKHKEEKLKTEEEAKYAGYNLANFLADSEKTNIVN